MNKVRLKVIIINYLSIILKPEINIKINPGKI